MLRHIASERRPAPAKPGQKEEQRDLAPLSATAQKMLVEGHAAVREGKVAPLDWLSLAPDDETAPNHPSLAASRTAG